MTIGEGLEPHLDVKSFRPAGFGRYVVAAFLAVWLAGWLVGEVFALGALVAIVASLIGAFPESLPSSIVGADIVKTSGVTFVILFLLVWLTFWTFGGVAALTHAMRSIAGEDLIALTPSGFEVVRRAGPFRRRLRFDREGIRRIRTRAHDGALMIDAASGTRVLTSYGSRAERGELAAWLNGHLHLPAAGAADAPGMIPRTWEVRTEADVTYIRKSRRRDRVIRAIIASILTGAIAIAWRASLDAATGFNLPAFVLTLLVAAGALLTTWSRREWIVRRGEATLRWSVAVWTWERTFQHAHLYVTHSVDGDSDSHYELVITDARGSRTVHSQANDSGEVVDVAHWLADRTGFQLSIRA
jgi:hypothetical protein